MLGGPESARVVMRCVFHSSSTAAPLFSLEFAELFSCGKPSETRNEGRNGVPSVQIHETTPLFDVLKDFLSPLENGERSID